MSKTTEKKITAPGFVNVDKPSGTGSTPVVGRIKRLTGYSCGHMGTLDPLASGVLPVGIGNATRLFDYFLEKRKVYVAEFTFGVVSDTLDTTVETIPCGFVPKEEEIVSVLPRFTGNIMQVPPKYSAKNVGGKRGYDLARAGVDFELPPKQVRVERIVLLGKSERAEGAYRFEISCGGGTYIRSLARDIAEALGTKAVMSGLRRTQSGYFKIEDSVPFGLLTEENIASYVIPTERVLPFGEFIPDGTRGAKIFNGVTVSTEHSDGLYKIYREGIFYGIAEVKAHRARIRTKLC